MEAIKEVCVESFSEAVDAVKGGATRIELCENLTVGGTTPSFGTIKQCLHTLPVPVMVMIRPRGGNFCYSSSEIEIMKEDIAVCKSLGVYGVVFGVLTSSSEVDIAVTAELVQLAKPMQITFHKAIDEAPDLLIATTLVRAMGIDRILSSGGKATAAEGAETLRQMIALAGPHTRIIVAGKVTHENLDQIAAAIPSSDYHGRRLVAF